MSVMTFFFAGTNHAMGSHCDTFEQTYNEVKPPKAFFPGPGGTPPNIFVSSDLKNMIESVATKETLKGIDIKDVNSWAIDYDYKRATGGFLSSLYVPTVGLPSLKRISIGTNKVKCAYGQAAISGKGWNKNVWYAIQLIAIYLKEKTGTLTLNVVGHSRGSITVIMLLNDLFYVNGSSVNLYVPFSTVNVPLKAQTFDKYKKHLEGIWRKRLGCQDQAQQGIAYLEYIRAEKARLEVNAFLFDPVAGPDSDTERRQTVPQANNIKRIRALRMENVTDATLSAGVPQLGQERGWDLLDGSKKGVNLWARPAKKERIEIPLPGSHGAGMALGKKKKAEKFIGTSLMVWFLKQCGTDVDAGPFRSRSKCLKQYEALKKKYGGWKGGTSYARAWINPDNKLHGGWKSGYLNAHHRWLAETAKTSKWK